MDVFEKKNKLVTLIENYISNPEETEELVSYVKELSTDPDFRDIPLFKSVFKDLTGDLSEVSRKMLKQTVLIIKDYNDF
jgi:hypothetical protein